LDVQKYGLCKALAKLPRVTPVGADSQIDSHAIGFHGQGMASVGTQGADNDDAEAVETEEDGHALARFGTVGQKVKLVDPVGLEPTTR